MISILDLITTSIADVSCDVLINPVAITGDIDTKISRCLKEKYREYDRAIDVIEKSRKLGRNFYTHSGDKIICTSTCFHSNKYHIYANDIAFVESCLRDAIIFCIKNGFSVALPSGLGGVFSGSKWDDIMILLNDIVPDFIPCIICKQGTKEQNKKSSLF